MTRVAAILILMVSLTRLSGAAEPQPPLPYSTPLPVVEGAAAATAATDTARRSNQALVIDLTTGQGQAIVAAPTAGPLAPGRYRLHVLATTTPHDHILVDAVELRLQAGDSQRQFERQKAFPKAGELTPLYLDFDVEARASIVLTMEWVIGNSMLDRQRYRTVGEARRVYLAQRQDAINQHRLKTNQHDRTPTADGGLGIDSLLGEEERPRLRPHALDARDLPAYRLVLTGLVVERLSPVVISELQTSQPAYEPGTTGEARVTLRNLAAEPVKVSLNWELADDARLDETLASHTEELQLAAGQSLVHPAPAPISTTGVDLLGHLKLSAAVGPLRPNQEHVLFVMLPPERQPYARDKRIFAHYMGCWPIANGATLHDRKQEAAQLKHESSDPKINRGGHTRNWDLRPPDMTLTAIESADLEIRRALRIGLDGFAVDAWAGGDDARRSLVALFDAAVASDYPFEITVCIDPATGGSIYETVKWLVETYGDHPKLARRDGRPLIFGYFSKGPAFGYADRKLQAQTDAEKIAVRQSPLGWHLAGLAFRDAERHVGQRVFWHFSMEYLFHPFENIIPQELEVEAIATIARHVDAVGAFSHVRNAPAVAAAVKQAGAEWSSAIGMYQKENIPFEVYIPPGTEWLHGKWQAMRELDATLPQLITWNDYGENTNIAPGLETRYTLYDLTGYHIAWWKNGQQPEIDRDRIYLIYAKYPRDATVWPFTKGANVPRNFEVLTILTSPGTIRLPGRDIEFEAPAGYSTRQFPLTVGPVIAELLRDDQVVIRLDSPEPITDRPFRESNGFVCWSTEFFRHWHADFGDADPFLYSEYADDDGDGLPNWFEMYWFTNERGFKPAPLPMEALLDEPEDHPVTRWNDYSTMTLVDPHADPNRDGKTNLESYLERIDPTRPAPPKAPGD